jgi:hypothetical protein
MPTMTQPSSERPMKPRTRRTRNEPWLNWPDADVADLLEQFNAAMLADGLPFNPEFMWRTATDPVSHDLRGEEFVLFLAMASLTEPPSQECRATHQQIIRRAHHLNTIFAFANDVGWEQIMRVLGILKWERPTL